ncbi:MAG: hypothetical protein ACKO38_19870 [Planctomycetota bacterium]
MARWLAITLFTITLSKMTLSTMPMASDSLAAEALGRTSSRATFRATPSTESNSALGQPRPVSIQATRESPAGSAKTFKFIHDEPAEATTGISPYANWDDRGMRPTIDPREAREDVTETQRRQINAAYGGQRYRAREHCVAGHPTFLRHHAFPSDTGRYFGYQIGGGTIFPGTGRDLDEGTFGWDYANPLFPTRAALGWSHRREQGGTGAYATDHKKRGE